MNKNQTYNAPMGMQLLADRFGAKAVPVETGVAIIGCAPAIADAVLQGWPQPEGRIHLPRRLSTYSTHSDHETDVRLSSPSAGHDLTWMAATGGQMHPSVIAAVLFEVLGAYPATESMCALNPGMQTFEQLIQTTVPAHLRQRMLMGPAADGSILVGERNRRVYPFTEIKQPRRHRASDDTRSARLLEEALRSNPDPSAHTTIFAQIGTMDIYADEIERARSAPVMIPPGGGIWNATRQDNGSSPAAYTMPSLGTQLALALWPGQHAENAPTLNGVAQANANDAPRAVRTTLAIDTAGEDSIRIHSQYDHWPIAPGDMIVTAVSNGGTIKIRSACEVIQISLTHHAWVAICHPFQANLQAARHIIDPVAQIELESVTGIVWHYRRRRQPNRWGTDTEEPTGFPKKTRIPALVKAPPRAETT